MGLLGEVLAGGLAQAGDTVSSMLVADHNAQLQNERDQANAVREENLTRLRASLSDQTLAKQQAFELKKGDIEFGRGPSGMLDPETGKPLTREETKAKAPEEMVSPTDDAIDQNFLVNGKPASVWDVKTALQENPTSVTRTKEVDAETRIEATKALAQMKIDNALQIAEMKLQNARDLLNAKIAAGHNSDSSEVKKLMAGVRQAEEQRKSADSAAKLLDLAGGIDKMSPEQLKLYNNYLKQSGIDDAPAAPTAKDKPKKKGLIASTVDFFTGDDAKAEPAAAPKQDFAKTKASGNQGKYDFASLPKGSQPVPGKFTKDGRPVFKTPKGQLVAPQLTN